MTDKTSTFTILEQGTTRVLLLPVLIAASTLAVAIAVAQELPVTSPPSTGRGVSPPSQPGGPECKALSTDTPLPPGLGDIPPGLPADIRSLIEKTFSSDPTDRAKAAKNLGTLGKRAVPSIPFLIRLAAGGDSGAREQARRTLASLGQPAADGIVAAFRVRAYQCNPVCDLLEDTFRLMPGEVAVPTLIGVLEDKDPKIRGTAARLLGNFPGKRAVDALIHRLGDVDQNVICSAAWALGHLRDPRAADALIAVLGNRKLNPLGARLKVAWAIGQIGVRRAFDPLLAVYRETKESDEWVLQNECAIALGATKDPPRARRLTRGAGARSCPVAHCCRMGPWPPW